MNNIKQVPIPYHKSLIFPKLNDKSQSVHSMFPVKLSYNFNHFLRKLNKNNQTRFIRSQSQGNSTTNKAIEKKIVESNFKSIKASANRFTENVPYIKNKKMALFDKYTYDNDNYKTDRVGKYDMKKFNSLSPDKTTLFKTTVFRNNNFVNKKLQKDSFDCKNLYYTLMDDNKYQQEQLYATQNEDMKNIKKIQPSNSFYRELNLKKNEIVDKYFKDKNIQINSMKKNTNKNTSQQIVLLHKRKIDNNITLSFPCCVTYKGNYQSTSEQVRYEKIMDNLLKLKYLISIDNPKKEYDYIKAYIICSGIKENEITRKKLEIFKKFLKNENFQINPNLSVRQNILNILNGKENINKDNKSLEEPKKSNSVKNINKVSNDNSLINNKISKIDNFNLEKQTKLYKSPYKTEDEAIIQNLQKELDELKEQIINNKLKVNQPKRSTYPTMYITQKDAPEEKSTIDLRLGNCEEDNLSISTQFINKKKKKKQISEMNERLYYSKIEGNDFNIQNYKKNQKLTEYIMLERIKNKKALEELKKKQKISKEAFF